MKHCEDSNFMGIFNKEYDELKEWFIKKTDECLKIPWEGGRDGESSHELHKTIEEYNRRLQALKEKYGIKT
jgi:hypothetical protein